MRRRGVREARVLHPAAWWLWAGALAAAAVRTTNPILLLLVAAVVAYVVAARRLPPPWGRSFASFLRLGVAVVAIRLVVTALFGARLPGHVVLRLPEVALPSWAAGVSIGGPVTVESMLGAVYDGLRLAVVLACFGAANSLASPYRLLRSMPAVLYEAGVAVTVALSFAPQAVAAVGRVHEARRLRGRPTRGVAGLRGLGVPVLEGALERSLHLAESMDARGYGRRAAVPAGLRRAATVATAAGLLVVCVGAYGVLDAGSPGGLGLPLVGSGAVLLAVGLLAGNRRTNRTRYRPDPWAWPEWVVVASGAVAVAAMIAAGHLAGHALAPSVHPLEAPGLPLPALAGIAVALLPAFAAPVPPGAAPSPRAAAATLREAAA